MSLLFWTPTFRYLVLTKATIKEKWLFLEYKIRVESSPSSSNTLMWKLLFNVLKNIQFYLKYQSICRKARHYHLLSNGWASL
jgi:hypothetical protein